MSADGAPVPRRGKQPGPHFEKRLNAAFVKTAQPGRHTDGGGLFLTVDASGARRWLVRLVIRGRRRDIGLGSATLVPLGKAREKAQALRAVARVGGDPLTPDQGALPPSITFEKAAAEVHRNQIKTTSRNGKHTEQWLSTLRTYAFPYIGKSRVYDITRSDILTILEPIWLTKPETARRVLQRMKTVFDWTLVKEYRVAANPVEAVRIALPRQKKKVEHFAAIPWDDTPAVMADLEEMEGVGALALRFTILTAARSGSVRKATWAEFSKSSLEWSIPADHMKGGEGFVVPLSSAAIAVLREAKRRQPAGADLVFPSPTNPRRPISENTMAKALGVLRPGATVHGMRSAFRDWAEIFADAKREVKESALAHSNGDKVESAYLRTDYLYERERLMEVWGCWLAGEGGTYDDIINRIQSDLSDDIAAMKNEPEVGDAASPGQPFSTKAISSGVKA